MLCRREEGGGHIAERKTVHLLSLCPSPLPWLVPGSMWCGGTAAGCGTAGPGLSVACADHVAKCRTKQLSQPHSGPAHGPPLLPAHTERDELESHPGSDVHTIKEHKKIIIILL